MQGLQAQRIMQAWQATKTQPALTREEGRLNCKAKTQGGKQCQAKARTGRAYCFTHDPASARDRAAAHRKGGQRTRTEHGAAELPRQVNTIEQARGILEYTLAEIGNHENSLARARVLIALFDSFIKALEIGELEQRIKALEDRKP